MEIRFRRYLTLRRLNSEPLQTSHTPDDLATYSLPYERTTPAVKAPIFMSQPLWKSFMTGRRTTDESDSLAGRAFSYDSVLPGKPPVLGGRPYKGNGPVKLQTSRRLSSGELLTTTQDNKRTLDDIREGDYIIGKKEKRDSQFSQIKTSPPSLAGPASPRFQGRATPATPREPSVSEPSKRLLPPSPFLNIDVSHSPLLPASFRDSPPLTPGLPSPRLLPPDSGCGIRSTVSEPLLTGVVPPKTARSRVPSATASLLTKGEEHNATIQALWKAEYGRLVAIYGREGVDRNIAELSRDNQTSPPLDVGDGSQDHYLQSAMMLQPLPIPSFDAGWTFNSARNSRGSLVREGSTFDDASDYSSLKPSSIMSEGSSSSYTKRTSLYEPDPAATREDVHRVVENMRSNYLKAIESTTRTTAKAKPKRKPRVRASGPNAPATDSLSPPATKPPKGTQQSRHGHNAQAALRAEKRKTKTKPATAQPPSPKPKASALRSSVKPKAPLYRADSLTLGVLVPSIPLPAKAASPESSRGDRLCLPAQHALPSSFTNKASKALEINRGQYLEVV